MMDTKQSNTRNRVTPLYGTSPHLAAALSCLNPWVSDEMASC